MSYTVVYGPHEARKEAEAAAENAVNRAFRRCRIGKVTLKPLLPPLRSRPRVSPYRRDYDKIRDWGYSPQPLGPLDRPLITWQPFTSEPFDTYTLCGASHAH